MVNRSTILSYNSIFIFVSYMNLIPYKWDKNKLRFEIQTKKRSLIFRRLFILYTWCHTIILFQKLYVSYKLYKQAEVSIVEIIIHIFWIMLYTFGSICQLNITLNMNEILNFLNHIIYVCCHYQGKTIIDL